MHKIEKKGSNYWLTFSGFIAPEEMKQWVDDSKATLAGASGSFGVFVDMRELKPLGNEAKAHMEEGQKLFKMKGMTRSVVIVNSAMTAMQFKRIARDTGIYELERYLSAADNPDLEKAGLDWLNNSVDPD